jgi:enterochelin esterase-like enzyme
MVMVLAACQADERTSDHAVPESTADVGAGLPRSLTSDDLTTTTAADMSCAPRGGIARITVQSATVMRPIRVSVVAAPGASAVASVLYLLHGAGTDESQWEAIGVEGTLDDLVSTGRRRPFVVVLPDLPSDTDPALDGAALLNDIIPAVEKCSGGTRPPTHRAVGGISRGGVLALEVAADHPDQFAAVGGHSPAVPSNEIASLARRLASSHVQVWLDVGSDDTLRSATNQLADALTNHGAPPTFAVATGGHNRTYWAGRLPDYLQWYASAIGT